MQLAGGGPKFASFAKSGDKITNLATLPAIGGPTEGFPSLRERVYASGCGKERHGANGVPPVGAVNDFHDILSAKETSSNGTY